MSRAGNNPSCSPVGYKLCSISFHKNITDYNVQFLLWEWVDYFHKSKRKMSKIIKVTHSLFLHCWNPFWTQSSADQYVASMDAWCNISSLLSAGLLCPNSSSLLFSMHYTRSLCLSVSAFWFSATSLLSSHNPSCLFFAILCLHLFIPLSLLFLSSPPLCLSPVHPWLCSSKEREMDGTARKPQSVRRMGAKGAMKIEGAERLKRKEKQRRECQTGKRKRRGKAERGREKGRRGVSVVCLLSL